MSGIELDYETGDRIALAVLKDHLSILKDTLADHRLNGVYMHPEDAYNSEFRYIPAFEIVIKYFGGET